MANELDRLLGFYPLSHQWKSPTLFEDTIEIGDFELKLVGLSAEHESGQMVLGSAAASQGDVLTRAYFELIERTSIIEAVNAAERPFPLVSEFGVMKTTTTSQKVFPQSPDPARWKYSLSSGVAAHTDFSLACRSANWELIERDRILRSWYGEIVPCQIPTHPCSLPAEIESLYDVQWFRFPDGSPNNEVALVLFLPRGQRVLRSYGFGAGLTLDAACSKALSEAMQGMGFLWGEKASADLPDFAPTAEYHQEVFLREEGVRRLQRWLVCGHTRWGKPSKANEPTPSLFIDITPDQLRGRLSVVKALNSTLIPLIFGLGSLAAPAGFPEELLIHPIP